MIDRQDRSSKRAERLVNAWVESIVYTPDHDFSPLVWRESIRRMSVTDKHRFCELWISAWQRVAMGEYTYVETDPHTGDGMEEPRISVLDSSFEICVEVITEAAGPELSQEILEGLLGVVNEEIEQDPKNGAGLLKTFFEKLPGAKQNRQIMHRVVDETIERFVHEVALDPRVRYEERSKSMCDPYQVMSLIESLGIEHVRESKTVMSWVATHKSGELLQEVDELKKVAFRNGREGSGRAEFSKKEVLARVQELKQWGIADTPESLLVLPKIIGTLLFLRNLPASSPSADALVASGSEIQSSLQGAVGAPFRAGVIKAVADRIKTMGEYGWQENALAVGEFHIMRDDGVIRRAAKERIASMLTFVGMHGKEPTLVRIKKMETLTHFFHLRPNEVQAVMKKSAASEVAVHGIRWFNEYRELLRHWGVTERDPMVLGAAREAIASNDFSQLTESDIQEYCRTFALSQASVNELLEKNLASKLQKGGHAAYMEGLKHLPRLSQVPMERLKRQALQYVESVLQTSSPLTGAASQSISETARFFDVRVSKVYPSAVSLLATRLDQNRVRDTEVVLSHLLPDIPEQEVLSHLIEQDELAGALRWNTSCRLQHPVLDAVALITGGLIDRQCFDFVSQNAPHDNEEREGWIMYQRSIADGALLAFEDRTLPLDIDELQANPPALLVVRSSVRFDTSEFGSHKEDAFIQILRNYQESYNSYPPLPEGYHPFTISVDEALDSEVVLPGDVKQRIKILVGSIAEAKRITHPSDYHLFLLHPHIEARLRMLKRGAKGTGGTGAKERAKQIALLEAALQVRDSKKFREDSKTRELFFLAVTASGGRKAAIVEHLRQVLILRLFDQNPGARNVTLPEHLDAPTADELNSVRDFIDHLTHRESWSGQFTTVQGKRALQSLLGTRGIDEVLAQTRSTTTGKQMELEVVPTKDVRFDLSGHLADACWAVGGTDKGMTSMNEQYPNTLAMMYRIRQGKKTIPAGAGLLIEAAGTVGERGDKEKLLILRGTNPLESVINKISPHSFMVSLIRGLRVSEQRRNGRLAISIDDHSGGHASNRIKLFQYLESIKEILPRAYPESVEDSTVNGYNIMDETFLLPEGTEEWMERIERRRNDMRRAHAEMEFRLRRKEVTKAQVDADSKARERDLMLLVSLAKASLAAGVQ